MINNAIRTLIFSCLIMLSDTKALFCDPILYQVHESQNFEVNQNRIISLHCRPGSATHALIYIEGQEIRYKIDGTTPAAPNASTLRNLNSIFLTREEARLFQAVKQTGFTTRMYVLWLILMTP